MKKAKEKKPAKSSKKTKPSAKSAKKKPSVKASQKAVSKKALPKKPVKKAEANKAEKPGFKKEKKKEWNDSYTDEHDKVETAYEGEDEMVMGEEEPIKLDDFNFEAEEEDEEGFYDEDF